MRRGVGVWIAVLALALGAAEAAAGTTYTWSGGAGDWGTTTNWSPNGTPGAGDTVIFNPSGACTITLGADRTVEAVQFQSTYAVELATSGSYTLTVTGAPGAPTANANLVGYWRLDESSGSSAEDDSTPGTDEDGTTSGNTAWSTAVTTAILLTNPGCMEFTGATGSVSFPTNAELKPTTALSITLWVKRNGDPGAQASILWKDREVNYFPAYALTFSPTAGSYSTLRFYLGSVASYDICDTTTDCVPDATWVHLACVYKEDDANEMIIYKNGNATPNATANKDSDIYYATADGNVCLGDSGASQFSFTGWIDDVRIYNIALTTAQVAAIYAETQASSGATLTVDANATPTISGKLALGTSSYTFDVASGATCTVSAVASGSGNLVKSGTGTLVLSGANTYTGTTTVKDGTLKVAAAAPSGSAGALGNAATAVLVGDTSGTAITYLEISGAYTVGRTITVQAGSSGESYLGQADASSGVFSGNVTANKVVYLDAQNASGTATFSGIISGANAVTKTGPGTVKLTGTNTYTGATTVANGTLTVGANAPSGSAGTLGNASSAVLVGWTSGTTAATLQMDGTYTVGRAITVQSGSSGTKTVGGTNTSGTATYSGAVTLNTAATLTAASGGTVNFTGVISGANNVTVSGGGTVQFSSSGNTYSGTTTVSAGTLKYGAADQLANTMAVTVSSGATLDLNGYNDTIASMTVNGGTVQTGAGTLTLSEPASGDPTAVANLVGYWRLDETSDSSAEDDSPLGTDEDGTTSGGTAWSASVPTGVLFTNPRCMEFTGATGKVSMATNAELIPSALSITLWVKRNGNQGAQASIFWKNRVADNTFPGYGLVFYPSADTAYASTLWFMLGTAASYDVCQSSSDCVPDATWVHLACVFKEDDANEMILYKNGSATPNATANKDTTIDYGTDESVCLGDSGAVQFAFTGWLDDVRIYNIALTTAQVAAIYAETQAGGTAGGVTESGTSSITGNVAFGSSLREFDVASGGTLTVTAVLSGAAGLTKKGDGTLKVSGTNTYTGVTTVKAGTLLVDAAAPSGSAGALGNAATAVLVGDTSGTYSASLLTNGAYTVARAVTVQAGNSGTMTLGGNSAHSSAFTGNVTMNKDTTLSAISGGTATFSTGAISGAFNVTKSGVGTVKLSGTNTYTGTTTVKDGTLVMGGAVSASTNGPVGNAATAISLGDSSGTAAATLVTDGANSIGRAVTVNSGSSGTKTLGGTNTSGTTTWTGNITLTGSATFTAAAGGALDVKTGVVSGAGNLTKTGDGSLTLSGTNTYTGTTTVNAGLLLLGTDAPNSANGALGNAGTAVLVGDTSGTASAFLETIGAYTVGRAITVQSGNSGVMLLGGGTAHASSWTGNVVLNKDTKLYAVASATATFSTGVISGAGAVTVDGGGTVKVSGTNTYSGATSVIAGTLVVGAAAPASANGALGNASSAVLVGDTSGTAAATLIADGTYSVGRAVTIQTGSSGTKTIGGTNTSGTTTWTGNITMNDNATVTAANGGTVEFKTGAISGSGNVAVSGVGGTVKFSGTNSYSGSTTVQSGTLVMGASGADDGTSGITVGHSSGADTATLVIDTAAVIVAANLTVPSTGGTKTVGGTNTSGTATYTGNVVLTGDATITAASGGTVTFSTGVISGAGAFTKVGLGTVRLYGANTYTGTTTVNAGTLYAAGDAPASGNGVLGNHAGGAILVGDNSGGSDLAYLMTLGAFTIGRDITVRSNNSGTMLLGSGSGSGAFTGNITLNKDTTFTTPPGTTVTVSTGVVSGAGGINKTNTGTLVLSGTNTYTGTTTISEGVILVGANAPASGNGALGHSDGGAILVGNTSGTYACSLLTNGAYTVGRPVTVRSGNSGAQTLGGNTAHSSEFTGNVTMNKDTTLSAISGGTATFSTGVISGAFNITKSGVGTVKLSGTNTYSGTTTINAGTVVVGANAPSGSAGALGNAATAVLLGNTSGTDAATIVMDGAYTVGRTMTVQSGSSGTKSVGGTNTSGTSTYSAAITLNDDTTLTAASGGTVDFTGTIVGAGDDVTKAGAGIVKANSAVSAATLTVSAGRYWIPAAKTTTIDDLGSTTVSAGELYLVGSSGSVATLTSAGTHTVSVSSGGTIWGRHFTIDDLNATGVVIADGGTIADMSWGTLTKAVGVTGPALDLSAVTGASRAKIPQSFQGVTFTGDAGIKNVEAGVDTPVIRFFGSNPAYGNRWGETNENDPGQIPGFAVGRIVWASSTLKRMTSETASDASYDTIKDALDANTGAAARFRWYGNPVINEEIDVNDYTLPATHAIEGGIYLPVQPSSGARYAFKDGGAGPRVILRNAVVARGGVQEMTCQNVTIFQPAGDGTNVQDMTGCSFVNCIKEVANTGTTEIVGVDDLTLKTSDGTTYFAGHSVLDYHLKSGATLALSGGSDQSGTYTKDFEEGDRAAGAYDIGADEYKAGLVAVHLESQGSTAIAGDIGMVSRIHTVGARAAAGPYGYMMTMGGSSGTDNDYFYVVKYAGGDGGAPKIVAKRSMANPVHNFMYYKITNSNIKIYALVDTDDDGYADAIHAMTDTGTDADGALTDDATFNGREGYQPGGAGGRMKFINVWRPESALWRLFVVKAPDGSGDEGTLYKINADTGDSTDDADQQYGEIIWDSGVERKYDWRSPITTNGNINEAFISVSNSGANHLVVRKPLTSNSNPAVSVSFTGGLSGGENIGGQVFGYVGGTRYLMVAPAGGQMFSVQMQGVSSDTRWLSPNMGGTLRGQPTKYINTDFVVCGMDDSVVKVVEKGGTTDDGIAAQFGADDAAGGGDDDTDWPMDCKGNVSTWLLMNGTSQLYWGTDQGACYGATFDPAYHATPETGDEAVMTGFPYFIPGHRVVWTFRVPSTASGAGIYFVTDQGAVLRIPHQ